MNLTVGLLDNETFINGAPIKHSQVTRMICPVLLCKFFYKLHSLYLMFANEIVIVERVCISVPD